MDTNTTTTNRNKETWAVKRFREYHEKLGIEKEQHKETKEALHDLQEQYNALQTDYDEVSKMLRDYQERFIKGGVIYAKTNGYVTFAVEIPPYSEYTYSQPIHEAIGTKLYNSFPFITEQDRQLGVDEIQYKKYLGGM